MEIDKTSFDEMRNSDKKKGLESMLRKTLASEHPRHCYTIYEEIRFGHSLGIGGGKRSLRNMFGLLLDDKADLYVEADKVYVVPREKTHIEYAKEIAGIIEDSIPEAKATVLAPWPYCKKELAKK